MKLIYLASPYSHPDPAGRMTKRGLHVFSPIAHSHPLSVHADLPGDWDYWQTYDIRMISDCDELHVLKLDGWQTSTGVTAEIKIARELLKPISYLEWLQLVPATIERHR